MVLVKKFQSEHGVHVCALGPQQKDRIQRSTNRKHRVDVGRSFQETKLRRAAGAEWVCIEGKQFLGI